MHYAVVGFEIDYSLGSICKKKKKKVYMGFLIALQIRKCSSCVGDLLSVPFNCCMKCDKVILLPSVTLRVQLY